MENRENEVTFDVEFEPEEKSSFWESIPFFGMFFRYKNDDEIKQQNGITELP